MRSAKPDAAGEPPPAAFIADAMVGRLAKWLRWLGCDTLYHRSLEHSMLLRVLDTSDRLLLTRTVKLAQSLPAARVLFIRHDRIADQLNQVIYACQLDATSYRGSRCMLCNALLIDAPRESVRGLVPAYTYSIHHSFKQCPQCRRIYWDGSHRTNMSAWIDTEVLPRRRP